MERRTNKLSNSRTPWLIMVPTKLRVVQTLSKNTIPLLFTVFWECNINMKIKSSSFPKHDLIMIHLTCSLSKQTPCSFQKSSYSGPVKCLHCKEWKYTALYLHKFQDYSTSFKSNVARYLLFTCLSRNRNWEVHPVT